MWVQAHVLGQSEVPDATGPAFRMGLPGTLVGSLSQGEDLLCLATVTLSRCHIPQGAVTVLVVVPVLEVMHPLVRLFKRGEALRGEAGALLQRAEERFGVGVVVADSGAAA